MSQLTAGKIGAGKHFTVHDNSSADTGTERYGYEIFCSLSCACDHLTVCSGVGVIFKENALAESVFKHFAEFSVCKAEVCRIAYFALLGIYAAG